jgi:hypothetical protein
VNRRHFLRHLSQAGVAASLPLGIAAQGGAGGLPGAIPFPPAACPKRRLSLAAAIAQIRTLNTEFPIIGIYRKPNDQDRQSAGSGMGIHPCNGKTPCTQPDYRSEQIYPPFIMAPRRQTDYLVRQAYLLLPEQIRKTTAFVIVDRLLQFPEAYLAYLRRKQHVVLVGSFFGIDGINTTDTYEASDTGTGVKSFHRMQLRQLEYALTLLQSLHKPIVDIIYGMGDSTTPFAINIRQALEQQSRILLRCAGLDPQLLVLDWGADELIFKAFARRLPPLSVKLILANPAAKHHYDGYQTTQVILSRTLASLGLTAVSDAMPNTTTGTMMPNITTDATTGTVTMLAADIQVLVFDRHPQALADFNAGFSPGDPQQAAFDRQFRAVMSAIPAAQQPNTVVIDGRNPNGALNSVCLPTSDRYLGFGSWGTFANACGQTLAVAKLLFYAKQPATQRQLLLEAIAHDVFCVGHAAAQAAASPLRQRLQAQNLRYLHKENLRQPYDLAEITQVFRVMTEFVNEQIQLHLPGSGEFVVIPQLWRTFESQVFLKQGPLTVAGVFRRDLPAATFNPLQLPGAKTLTLQDLNQNLTGFSSDPP